MVKMQIDISEKMSRYLDIQRVIYRARNKRDVATKILEEKMVQDKEQMKNLMKNSIEV